MRLRDKWVVVTGGSSGIGYAIAERLVERGNRITLVADGKPRLVAATAALQARGGDVDYVDCDIAVATDVAALAAGLLARGTPDVLVNNAGYGIYRPFEASQPAEIERLLEVNLFGHIRLTKLLLAPMIERRSGAICFMASIAGRIPITPNAVYCAAKYGMMGFATTLRPELRRFGIGVSAICPGRVDTRFFDNETFRSRNRGLETRGIISATEAAEATIGAIERDRAVTYVPKALGAAAWFYWTFQPIVQFPYGRLIRKRMDDYYANGR